MSTDYQAAREALGARLRELRTEAGLEGKELASQLGCQPSKISRLQNGKQPPAAVDLTAWAQACCGSCSRDAGRTSKLSCRDCEPGWR